MVALLLLMSCASNIKSLYDDEKAQVMADPGPAPASWEPELRMRLSEGSLQELAEVALDAGMLEYKEPIDIKNPLGVKVQVTPKLGVSELTVKVDDRCDGCLNVSAKVEGKARWNAGGAKGKVPVSGRVKAGMAFSIDETAQGWVVSGRVTEVRKLKLDDAAGASLDLTSVLGTWTTKALEKVEPIELGAIGGEDLPLRAVRMGRSKGALEIQALTDVAGGAEVSASTAAPSGDWDLRIHEDTALALARREAFAMGTMDYDIAADPRSLSFDGSSFTMGLRLWRLKGAGWWREYSVTGDVVVGKQRIRLVPKEATEGEKSKGAGVADPLALLVEGQILQAVTDGLKQAFPGTTKTRVAGHRLTSSVASVEGSGDVVLVNGDIELTSGQGQAPAGDKVTAPAGR